MTHATESEVSRRIIGMLQWRIEQVDKIRATAKSPNERGSNVKRVAYQNVLRDIIGITNDVLGRKP